MEYTDNMSFPRITIDDIRSVWPYCDHYLVEILNGEYLVEDAVNDVKSLIGTKYDSRTKGEDNG